RLLMLLGVMTATGMVLVGAGWAQPLIILVSIALGASAFGWNGVYLSEVARLAPPDRVGEATGGAQFFFFGGAVSVPPVFGGIIELSGGYPAAFYAAAAMSLCASVAVVLSRPRKAA
ncbi:MAG: MFS transporter, partial [Alphaproteobacteria bacterium]|nr:MFS transporter [Alphaproteobacteria bacterium]